MKTLLLLLLQTMTLYGWNLPSNSFLQSFAKSHDAKAIIIYMSQSNSVPIKLYFNDKSKYKIPVTFLMSAQYQNLEKLVFKNQDLHVFIPDENGVKRSLETLTSIYNNRSRSREEQWLLDITELENLNLDLSDMNADVDDDLYLYLNGSRSGFTNSQNFTIYEAYRLQDNLPLKIVEYGQWNESSKYLDYDDTEKWVRRRDLTGVQFKCNTMPSMPYITKMTPKSNDSEEFDIEGMFAEVFFALQVPHYL